MDGVRTLAFFSGAMGPLCRRNQSSLPSRDRSKRRVLATAGLRCMEGIGRINTLDRHGRSMPPCFSTMVRRSDAGKQGEFAASRDASVKGAVSHGKIELPGSGGRSSRPQGPSEDLEPAPSSSKTPARPRGRVTDHPSRNGQRLSHCRPKGVIDKEFGGFLPTISSSVVLLR